MKFENTSVWGFKHALRGMRNPMNSWAKSDSFYPQEAIECKAEDESIESLKERYDNLITCPLKKTAVINGTEISVCQAFGECPEVVIGENDMKLAQQLIKAGNEHRKFLRMLFISVDITAPLYWWKEADTYKVGTVANSCSTMHKIAEKEFTMDDFAHEHLDVRTIKLMQTIIDTLNDYRNWYINYNPDGLGVEGCPSKKDLWWQMIQLLPSSYLQKRTVTMNYENVYSMVHQRLNHKLDEWSVDFINWARELPYAKKFIFWDIDKDEETQEE